MFRLFRTMRVEGRYDSALTMFDDVLRAQRGILGVALFVGATTWITVSALYYTVERRSKAMIYCGAAPDYCDDDIDTNLCEIDSWGITNCTAAGCPATDEYPEPCYNLYRSIPMASYYSLLNLFGEFPLIDNHNVAGKIVGTLVAIVAVAVFALPAGIIGNGFEDIVSQRHEAAVAAGETNNPAPPAGSDGQLTTGFVGDAETPRGRWYNFLHVQLSRESKLFDLFINLLIVGTALTFMVDTVSGIPPLVHEAMDIFEFVSVIVFTFEYVMRVYAAGEDPKYQGTWGRLRYMGTFLAMVDLLTVVPYWAEVVVTGEIVTPEADTSTLATLVKCLRIFRVLRFEKYTRAFTSFDDVFRQNRDVFAVTGFSALLMWVFLSAILYFTERNNPDDEMSAYYRTVPDAMWITLLNLTGESPLAQYSVWGKIVTGLLGLCATGLFGIPIGVLGAGFEEILAVENEDTPDQAASAGDASIAVSEPEQVSYGNAVEKATHNFVNGIGSTFAQAFEIVIYILILVSVGVGIWQTVEGQEDALHQVEWFSVIVFTVEYLIRFVGVGADPLFAKDRNGITSRLRFIVSFYSIIDLLAILPFYAAIALPNTWLDNYSDMFRLFRLLRLVKLDKYIPSITLIDDVLRLKKKSLTVAGFAAGTLWIIFSALLYLTEYRDKGNAIDGVPDYGCYDDCTMMDRFNNFLSSGVYTAIHLTGDYPIISYDWPARFVNFFMVIAAVGVVSIPSGLIASGFVQIVNSKLKVRSGDVPAGARAGDDWYEIRLRELEDKEPPRSWLGPWMDKAQTYVNELLNGKEDGTWTILGYVFRVVMFNIIVLNVFAVIAESVPEVDRAVGNQPGNFFDRFELVSVVFFATEYILRLFCAPKNKESLFSSVVYATTFFGIVDFLSTVPYFIEHALIHYNVITEGSDTAMMFRVFRIFRLLQLEGFIVAFSKLDNVFRASKDVLKATGLLALIIWIGCGSLFYIFEQNNPNFRDCSDDVPDHTSDPNHPGCYDFHSTQECNAFYPGQCKQAAFTNIPNALYYTAVFLGGEWGLVDFTWPGRLVCLFLCVAGIGLYAIPLGTLFDSFGAVIGMGGGDGDDEEEGGNGE